MSDESMRALVKRFFDCVEQVDIDGVADCYADDVGIWHNTDQVTKGKEANLQHLAAMPKRIIGRTFDNRRLQVFPGGFVQQHVVRGTRVHDGVQVAMPACIVGTVKNGKITRIEEYLDSAHVAEFRKFA